MTAVATAMEAVLTVATADSVVATTAAGETAGDGLVAGIDGERRRPFADGGVGTGGGRAPGGVSHASSAPRMGRR